MKAVQSTKVLYVLTAIIVPSLVFVGVFTNRKHLAELSNQIIEYRAASQSIVTQPTPTPDPFPTPTTAAQRERGVSRSATQLPLPVDSTPWGVAQKVDDVTYSIKVGEDERMATPQEILEALNSYRNVHGTQSLSWDDKLGSYAQSRAQEFQNLGSTDKHAGFNDYLSDENGFNELGYMRLGENSYYGGKLSGVHMIEWVFSQSPGHNANQLNAQWTHVGIGVTNNAANLIFGANR